MKEQDLIALAEKIRKNYPNDYCVEGFRIDAEELDRYAGQIEDNLDIYTDEELYEDELDILRDAQEAFDEFDNWGGYDD